MNILEKLFEHKLVVIARKIPLDKIGRCAEAVIRGGAIFIESTFDQISPTCIIDNQRIINEIAEKTDGKVFVGAGTVLSKEQVRAAFDAGAKYIISPNTNREVIEKTKKLGMLSFPGAMTPTEIEEAYTFGADVVKLFPADDLGYHYIKNITAPLSHIPLMATGGVNPETIPLFHECGIKAYGAGATILKRDYAVADNYDGIEALTKAHTDVIKKLQ